jgi:hypothetical protein
MKTPKPPAPAPASPPVKENGKEMNRKRIEMMRKNKQRKGARATILSDYDASPKNQLLG